MGDFRPPDHCIDRGKTSCPQRLARPRTTRNHKQGNGRKDDPQYNVRRLLRTSARVLSDKAWERLEAPYADNRNVPVEVMWGVYQKIVAAYRNKNPAQGKQLMSKVIRSVKDGVPDTQEELASRE
nr:transposase [Actinomyces procaprae]